jgi:F-type H+-transporting ATPase subunit b
MTSSMQVTWLLMAASGGPGDVLEHFGINGPKILVQGIVFIILVVSLNKFAFKPVLAILEGRRKQIEQSIANADRIRKELDEAERSRKEIMAKANEEATRFIDEARKTADAVGSKKIQEAISQAEAVLRKAEESAALERERIMAELRKEIGTLVVATTTKVVGKVLNDQDQARLRQESVEHLKS